MFNAQRFLPSTLLVLSFILALFLYECAEANDLAKALQQRSALQSAEIEWIKAQLELENWKHAQLEDLRSKGFAPWLEVRRHRLIVDSTTARLSAAGAIQTFLSDVETQRVHAVGDRSLVFCERESNPIKVFLPGSIRIIGWIEGQPLTESIETTSVESDISALQERLANAQTRFDETDKLQSGPASRREQASLELKLAQKELEQAELLETFQMRPHLAAAPQSISIDEIKNFVTADHSLELKAATSRVAIAEAAAVGHINSTRIMLQRQQRRRDAFHRLRSGGFASADELNIATEEVTKIQSQLDAHLENHRTLVEASKRFDVSEAMTSADDLNPVSSWPAVVFQDKEFALHLIDLRREYYDEQSIADIVQLQSDMLQEVMRRLKAAVSQNEPHSRLGSVLNEGKRNEVKAYELDIEIAKASLAAAIEKRQILIHEENRFIQQTIAQYEAARENMAKANSVVFGLPAALSFVPPAAAIVSSGGSKGLRHCSYRESGHLDAVSETSGLLFSQSNQTFIGSCYSIGSAKRFDMQPLQSLLLTGHSRGTFWNDKCLRIAPKWVKHLRSNPATIHYSISPYSLRSLSSDRSRCNYYGHDGYLSCGVHNLYPFGNLRSDLYRCVTPGQLPWYLPGSPSNIRSHHVYSRYPSRNNRRLSSARY